MFKFGAGAFLYVHPFIALQMTEIQISSGESAFYTRVPLGLDAANSILVPSPRIVYILLALLCSAVLVLLTMRMLRPTPEGPRRPRERKQRADAE